MPIKMRFPDGTEVEGEVEEILELLSQLKDLIGDFPLAESLTEKMK